jgi:hypothetical protein
MQVKAQARRGVKSMIVRSPAILKIIKSPSDVLIVSHRLNKTQLPSTLCSEPYLKAVIEAAQCKCPNHCKPIVEAVIRFEEAPPETASKKQRQKKTLRRSTAKKTLRRSRDKKSFAEAPPK